MKVDILHEVCHLLGFRHEFARKDGDGIHCSIVGEHESHPISFGQYDYASVVNYPFWREKGLDPDY